MAFKDDEDTRAVPKPPAPPPPAPTKTYVSPVAVQPAPVVAPQIFAAPPTLPVTGGTPAPTTTTTGGASKYVPPTVTYGSTPWTYRQTTTTTPAPVVAPNKVYYAPSSTPSSMGGIDEQWWNEFMREHNGVDPETYYKGDLDAAVRDRAWGDQFARTYGRPPSMYDWKASYYDRKYPGSGGYGVGGGGGYAGAGSAAAATPGMSPMWNAIFGNYYTTRAGQSDAGYADFIRAWASRAGRNPTQDEATRILTSYQNYLVNRPGAAAAPEDLYAYLERLLQQQPALPPVAYLQLGEI